MADGTAAKTKVLDPHFANFCAKAKAAAQAVGDLDEAAQGLQKAYGDEESLEHKEVAKLEGELAAANKLASRRKTLAFGFGVLAAALTVALVLTASLMKSGYVSPEQIAAAKAEAKQASEKVVDLRKERDDVRKDLTQLKADNASIKAKADMLEKFAQRFGSAQPPALPVQTAPVPQPPVQPGGVSSAPAPAPAPKPAPQTPAPATGGTTVESQDEF